MADHIFNVLLFALFPALATIVGGIVAAFRPPTPKIGSAIQHFAAGTVFLAVAAELLPDVVSKHAPIATILGFALGLVLMLVIKRLGEGKGGEQSQKEGKDEAQGVSGLLVAIGVDITIDGFLIGIGFAAGAKQGVLLTVALTLELLSLGLATATTLHKAGRSRGNVIVTVSALALLPLIAAVLGVTVLTRLSENVFDAFLAFGVAALLYLVTEELLVEAHEVPETPMITSSFFGGFLLLLIINMLV